MLKSLRTKVRPDNLQTQIRSGGRSLARRLYFASIVILLSFVLYYSIGAYFFLEADGLVAKERTEVSAMSLSRVVDVMVKSAQPVKAGDLLLTIQAPEVLQQLGQAQSRLADILRRDDQIRSRLLSISTLKPLAASYSARAKKYEEAASSAGTAGFASTSHLTGTARDSYNAARDLSLLETEEQALRDEMQTQDKLRGQASALIQEFESIFHNGRVFAPISGSIGTLVPDRGQVFRAGDPMLSINSGDPFVLAFVPTARLYSLVDGQVVIVTDGTSRVLGHVERIHNQNNLAATVPKDFQSAFRGPDVREVFRVRLEGASPFALFSKVRVVNPASPSNVSALLVHGIRSALQRIGLGNATAPQEDAPRPASGHE